MAVIDPSRVGEQSLRHWGASFERGFQERNNHKAANDVDGLRLVARVMFDQSCVKPPLHSDISWQTMSNSY